MKKYARIALFFALPVIVITCKEEDQKDCAKAICSEQFNSITVAVKDSTGQPVALDTFRLVNMLDKSAIKLSFTADDFAGMKTTGNYLLIDDSVVSQYQNSQIVVEFSAILGGKTVAKNSVTVSVDCCHVTPYYGDMTVVVVPPKPPATTTE